MRTLARSMIMVAGLAACDAEGAPGYEGEALLTVQGSITHVDGERVDSELIPALAWENQSSGTLYLRDVHVEGDFPASFRLAVLQPPPPEAIAETPEGLRYAIGYIVAVRPERPDVIVGSSVQVATGRACADDEPCPQTRQWCTWDQQCYVEEVLCEPGQFEDCTVISTTGDPALRSSPWEQHIEGSSENYAVFYALDRMPSTSSVAGHYNDWRAVRPGMYLLELGDPDEATIDAVHACQEAGYQRATEWYNAEHDTSFADADAFWSADLGRDAENEFELAFLRAAAKLRCELSYAERLVPRNDGRAVEIVIGQREDEDIF
jgi:hypothetical protein